MDNLDRLLHPIKGILRGLCFTDMPKTIPIKVTELKDIHELLVELKELREKQS